MSVQNNINVIWRVVGGYVLETELQSVSQEIDEHWPFIIAVAIPSHDSDLRPNGAELVENGLRANVAQMPDFIGLLCEFFNCSRQTIMGVGQNENTQGGLRFLRRWHSVPSYLLNYYALRAFWLQVLMHALICATADVT